MAYGIEVRTTNGSKIVLDPTIKATNLITCKISGVEATSVSLAAGATSSSITANGITTTNTLDTFIFAWLTSLLESVPTITRSSGSFTVTNNAASTQTVYFIAGRYK